MVVLNLKDLVVNRIKYIKVKFIGFPSLHENNPYNWFRRLYWFQPR